MLRNWFQFMIIELAAIVSAGAATSVFRCPGLATTSILPDAVKCGGLTIPKAQVDRLIFHRITRRGGDGLDAYLTSTNWPIEGVEPGNWLFVSWHDGDGARSVVFGVNPIETEKLLSALKKTKYSFFNAVQGREELKRRIAQVSTTEHARKYLEKPFLIADFHLGAGTYEFTVLESTDALDLLCVEDQAMFTRRRWWLIPAHILPTDDKRSAGVIVYEDPAAREPRVSEIRFPLKKALPVE
jgi:hypothetical protein